MIDVRRGADRFRTDADGRRTLHSFSFGAHYDPGNIGFGLLTAHNEEQLARGTGYDDHTHRETEIVSVLLEGSLRHDSDVGAERLQPGDVQRLSAGTGVVHAERAAGDDGARFVQAWLRPARAGVRPSYAVERAALGPVTAGMLPGLDLGPGSSAVLHLGRVATGATVRLPVAPLVHLFVAEGDAGLHAGTELVQLHRGDAVRTTDEGVLEATAGSDLVLLGWAMPAGA